MIFDLMTSPQGHQFDPRVKILLAFRSTYYPRHFDMPHDRVRQNKILTHGAPCPTPCA